MKTILCHGAFGAPGFHDCHMDMDKEPQARANLLIRVYL